MADQQEGGAADREHRGGDGQDQATGDGAGPGGAVDGTAEPDGSDQPDGTADLAKPDGTAGGELVGETATAETASGEPGGGETTPARPTYTTGWQRLSQTFARPPGATTAPRRPAPEQPDFSNMTDAEIRDRINRIDPTERKIGLAASTLAAVFTLIYTIPFMVSKIKVATTTKPTKHRTCPDHLTYTAHAGAAATCNGVLSPSHYAGQLVFGLVFAAAILVTVKIGRRAPMAFAIVLTGLALGDILIFVPFVVGGGWLLLRAWRTQRYGSPTAKAPVEGYVRPAPGSRRPASSAAKEPAGGGRNTTRRRRRDEPATPDSRPAPTASKRYTPKRPGR